MRPQRAADRALSDRSSTRTPRGRDLVGPRPWPRCRPPRPAVTGCPRGRRPPGTAPGQPWRPSPPRPDWRPGRTSGRRAWCRVPHDSLRAWTPLPLVLTRAGDPVEVCQKAVDGARAADRVGQLLTHEPLGQVDGLASEIGAQLGDDLLALSRELLFTRGDDPLALGLGLGLHVRKDLLALRTSVVADLGRFAARLGELSLVLGQLLLRL